MENKYITKADVQKFCRGRIPFLKAELKLTVQEIQPTHTAEQRLKDYQDIIKS